MDATAIFNSHIPPLINDNVEHAMPESDERLANRLAALVQPRDADHYSLLMPLLETAHSMIPSRYVVYQGFDFQHQQLQTLLGCRLPEDYHHVSRPAGSICFETLSSGHNKTASIQDLQTSAFAASDSNVRRYQLKTYLGAAVRVNDEVVGALAVFGDQPHRYDVGQTEFLGMLAQVISLFEEQCLLAGHLLRKINNSKLITAISATAVSAPPGEFMPYCLKKIGRWLHADGAALFWMAGESGQFQTQFENWCRASLAGQPLVEPRALQSLDIVRAVVGNQRPLFCADRAVLDGEGMRELLQHRELASALFLPLVSRSKVLGLCCIHFDNSKKEPAQEDIEVLMTVMGIVAQWREARSISSELDESQALNNQMLQSSPTAIYRIDFRKNRLLKVNNFMCRSTGYTEEELLNMNPEELLTPESAEIYRLRCQDVLSGRDVPVSIEYEIRTKHGPPQWARLHTRFVFEDGQVIGSIVVAHDVTEQKKVMEELAEYRKKLEALVKERTRALSDTNLMLHAEIANRTRTAEQLQMKTDRLKELNTAMGVLLDKRNEDRFSAQEHIRVNLRQLVEPYLERLAVSGLNPTQRQLLDVIRMNIGEVVDAPLADVSEKYYILSPGELQVANLIRNGKTTKDIAQLLNISTRTVDSYRNSIRKKLGLQNRRVNLKTYLSSKD